MVFVGPVVVQNKIAKQRYFTGDKLSDKNMNMQHLVKQSQQDKINDKTQGSNNTKTDKIYFVEVFYFAAYVYKHALLC